jgi:hypothetical protein
MRRRSGVGSSLRMPSTYRTELLAPPTLSPRCILYAKTRIFGFSARIVARIEDHEPVRVKTFSSKGEQRAKARSHQIGAAPSPENLLA